MLNTINELKTYLSGPTKLGHYEGRPVATSELMEMWRGLTDEEKEAFKAADLS